MVKKKCCGLEEISEQDFKNLYEPYTLKNDFLPMQLGKVFTDYFSKYEANQYDRFRNSEFGESRKILSNEEFVSLHGPKPWDVVNEILLSFSCLPYSVNSPEQLNREDRITRCSHLN